VSDAKFKIDNRDKNLSSHWQIGNVIRHGSPCFHSHVSIYTMYLPLKKKKRRRKEKRNTILLLSLFPPIFRDTFKCVNDMLMLTGFGA